MSGYSWHGRGVRWDPDRQVIEQERQRWIYESLDKTNELISELVRGPGELYRVHLDEYLRTGNMAELRMALEYVTV